MPAIAVAASCCGCTENGLSIVGVRLKLPIFHSPFELMPSCLIALRATSETTTLTMTWSRPRIVNELITAPFVALAPSPEVPTKALAMSMACVASEAFATLPTSRIEFPAGLTWISAPGIAARSVWRSTFRSRPTSISSAVICRPSASITNIEVAPSAMPMTKSLRAERTTAFATLGLATKTSLASRGSSTINERPIERSRRREIACSLAPTFSTGAAPLLWARTGMPQIGMASDRTVRDSARLRLRAWPRSGLGIGVMASPPW